MLTKSQFSFSNSSALFWAASNSCSVANLENIEKKSIDPTIRLANYI
jgi:hypothetical protein